MNRDRVERVVTNELNGRELNVPTEQLQREAQQALRGHSAQETNQNYRLYNEMAARAHLPQLELVHDQPAKPTHHHEAVRHERQPAHHVQEAPALPVPPVPPRAEAPAVAAPRVEQPAPLPLNMAPGLSF